LDENGSPLDTAWAMSEENVERACRFIEQVNRTGELGPDFDSFFHPEMEFEDEIGAYDTRDEVRAFLQGFAEAIGGLHVEVEETRDFGDVIMLVVEQSGRGSASGVPIAQPFTWLMRFADDRCVRWRIYADHQRALEDAGLSE
jgi:ketosteroid isomerase-like protein